jgi:hypothetical protein
MKVQNIAEDILDYRKKIEEKDMYKESREIRYER